MLFDNLPASKRAAPRAKAEPVLGVGFHAYINCPRSGQDGFRSVPMIDGSGQHLTNDLADGEEVEILSWRPRAREGLSYQIRRISDSSEWWVAAIYLRRLHQAEEPVSTSAVLRDAKEVRRGERD